MKVHEILERGNKKTPRIRVGRGTGCGKGKTSGRGHKGAAARSGWKRRPSYEGGQMPIIRRVAKRGFSNARFKIEYDVVNLEALESGFQDGERVDLQVLTERGVLRPRHHRLKILGTGELRKKLTVLVDWISQSARAKVEAAGGKVELTGTRSSGE